MIQKCHFLLIVALLLTNFQLLPAEQSSTSNPFHWSVSPYPADTVLYRALPSPTIGRSILSQPACFRNIKAPERSAGTSSRGTDFWVLFMRNLEGESDNLYLDITSEYDVNGTVSIPGMGISESFSLEANSITRVDLPSNAQIVHSNSIANLGVRVVSDFPVSVYGLNQREASTDGFLALPVSMLGTQHMVMTYPGLTWHEAAPSTVSLPQFAILSPYDNNIITITPADETFEGQPAGEPFQVTLNEGEAYMVRGRLSADYSADQTGSIISSSLPVAVFNGNSCTSVPQDIPACDHLVEQVPPISTWGTTFITKPLEGRYNGDTWRFLSSQNNTNLYINGDLVANLNFADFYETMLTEASVVEASNPILAVQFSNSQNWDNQPADPFMMTIPPYQQFLDAYTFSTPSSGFVNNYFSTTILTEGIEGHRLDGEPIDPLAFEQIQDSDFSAAGINIGINISYTINNELGHSSGLYVYGFNDYDSYGYAGGLSLININPDTGPQFELTTETLAYLCDSIPSAEDLEISAYIIATGDLPIESASLFYRTIEDIVYNSIDMQNQEGNLWSATIPGTEVIFPGLEFYLMAFDGQFGSTTPAFDPQQHPYVISIDNMPPQIIHTPVEFAVLGQNIPIEAEVNDNTDYVESVILFYRIRGGSPLYLSDEMINTGGNLYETTIDSAMMTLQGIEYYIKATDNHGSVCTFGSSDSPLLIEAEVNLVVATNTPENIESTSAVLGGQIINDGGLLVEDKGIIYGIEPNLIEEGESVSLGDGSEPFSTEVTNLEPMTQYFVMAYALNEVTTSYGEVLTFTTPALPMEVITSEPSNISSHTANVGGEVIYEGEEQISSRGVYFGQDPNPIDNGQEVLVDGETGSFVTTLTNLNGNTTYYVVAFATHALATAYGEIKSFTTLAEPPLVTTLEATAITSSSANIGGDVTYDGGLDITERGFYWSSEPGVINNGTQLTAGNGLGTFSRELEGLNPNATYYFAAYAVNDEGTAYGEEKMFTTLTEPPTVITGDATNITFESANISGQVTFDGGANVYERGFYYSVNPNPESTGNKIFEGEGTGLFSSLLTDLIPSTKYYYKAFATNLSGTEHGSVKSFVTDYEPVFIPNAFMPASTIEANRVFKPVFNTYPEVYEMFVKDNWGNIIYESNISHEGWDGNVNGTKAPPGGYVYRISFVDATGKQHEYHGIVILVR